MHMSNDVVLLAQELRWLQRAVERLEAQETVVPTVITDHGALTGLGDDAHDLYLLASAAGGRTAFATKWTDLTDAGATTLHKHDHGSQDGLGDDDHSIYAVLAGRSGGQSLSGGTAANDDLALQGTTNATRTSSYVILQPNGGNVGIGTSAPAANLHVNGLGGNANFLIDASTTAYYAFQQFGQGGVGKLELGIIPTSSDFYINTTVGSGAGGSSIYIKKADGNVGVNTITPAAKLHGVHSANIAPSLTYSAAAAYIFNSASVDLALGVNGASPYAYWLQARYLTGIAWTLALNPLGGNVGIGTTSPGANLHVASPSGNTQFLVDAYATSYYAYQQFAQGGAAKFEMGIVPTSSDFYMNTAVGSGSGGSSIFIKKSNGYVGIGTTAPDVSLDVGGSARVTNANWYYGKTTGGTGIPLLGLFSDNNVYIGACTDAGGKVIIREDGADVITLHGSNVGIGTSSPNGKLQVQGRVGINTGVNAVSAQLYVLQESETAGIPALRLTQGDVSEEFINFNAAVAAGNCIDTAAIGTYYGKVRVSVNGTFKYMALYNS